MTKCYDKYKVKHKGEFFNATDVAEKYNNKTGENKKVRDFFKSRRGKEVVLKIKEMNNFDVLEFEVRENIYLSITILIHFMVWLDVECEVSLVNELTMFTE